MSRVDRDNIAFPMLIGISKTNVTLFWNDSLSIEPKVGELKQTIREINSNACIETRKSFMRRI